MSNYCLHHIGMHHGHILLPIYVTSTADFPIIEKYNCCCVDIHTLNMKYQPFLISVSWLSEGKIISMINLIVNIYIIFS